MKKIFLTIILLAASVAMGGYQYKQFFLQNPIDTGYISAIIAYDDTVTEKQPLLVCQTGYGSCVDSSWFHRLVNYGYVVVNSAQRKFCDLNGFNKNTLMGAIETVDRWYTIKQCCRLYSQYIDTTKIAYVGYSYGSAHGFGMATRFPDVVQKYISYYGVTDYMSDFSYFKAGDKATIINGLDSFTVNPKPWQSRQMQRGVRNVNNNAFFYILHGIDDDILPVISSRRWIDSMKVHWGSTRFDTLYTIGGIKHVGTIPNGHVNATYERDVSPHWADSVKLKSWPSALLPSKDSNLIVLGSYQSKYLSIYPGKKVNPVHLKIDSTSVGWSDVLKLSYDFSGSTKTIKVKNDITARRIQTVYYKIENYDKSKGYQVVRTNLINNTKDTFFTVNKWVDTLAPNDSILYTITDFNNKKTTTPITGAVKWVTLSLPDSTYFPAGQQKILLPIDMRRFPTELWTIGTSGSKWAVIDSATGLKINRYIENYDSINHKGLMWIQCQNATAMKKYYVAVCDTFNNSDSTVVFNHCVMRHNCDESTGNLADAMGNYTMTAEGTSGRNYDSIGVADTTIFTKGIANTGDPAKHFTCGKITQLSSTSVTKFTYSVVYKFPERWAANDYRRIFMANFTLTQYSFAAFQKNGALYADIKNNSVSTAVKTDSILAKLMFLTQYAKIDFVYDGGLANGDRLKIYIDGNRIATSVVSDTIPATLFDVTGSPISYYGYTKASSFDGVMAESQLLDTSYSADYYKTQANAWMDNDNFWLIGPVINWRKSTGNNKPFQFKNIFGF